MRMRVSLKRLLLMVAGLVLIQVGFHLWSVSRPRIRRKMGSINVTIRAKSADVCPTKKCNPVKENMLNVHIIAHSHEDPGWLKTVDQYYQGQESAGDRYSFHSGPECVRCVLNTTIHALLANPDRRFIFIEMVFFSKWWNEISEDVKRKVRDLIKQGQLEFVIGGWCMSDAATTFYNDIIDQLTLGFDFIGQNFGQCAQSNIAWHVDQFGHSREHASIFAQMGFDAIFMGRIDFQDHNNRKATHNMEMIWKSSPTNLGDKAALFTHVTYDGYYAPSNFVMEGWNKVITDRKKDLYVDPFLKLVKTMAKSYSTNHILVTMGSDFGYRNAEEWFGNIDNLIKYVNERQASGSNVNVLYSTPSCYIHEVNKVGNEWPTKEDDFLPYSVPPKAYWTGYYTSKPGLKEHIKQAGRILQTCKQIGIFAELKDSFDRTSVLRKAVGVLQHHDAITGTSKVHVTNDYNKMLSSGTHACQSVIAEGYQKLMSRDQSPVPLQEFCPLLNISQCPVTGSNYQFVATAYNPLSWPVQTWIRVPVSFMRYQVLDPSGKEIPFQISHVPLPTIQIPERTSKIKTELTFMALLPPLGFSSYYISGEPDGDKDAGLVVTSRRPIDIANKYISISFDPAEGKIRKIENLDLGVSINLSQDFAYYVGDHNGVRATGAYVFQPRGVKTEPVARGPVRVEIIKGDIATEVHQEFSPWVSQVVRLYDSAKYVEFEWTVGPIPMEIDHIGKEVISLFKTELNSNETFYTDSDGREMIKRRRNHRDTWKLEVVEAISGNYYPVTSKIFIRDNHRNLQLTVLTDRCQGGSSIHDGEIELMVHRRTIRDDGLGVGEPLNELGVTGQGLVLKGKHYLIFDNIENSASLHRTLAMQIHMSPVLSFIPVTTSFQDLARHYRLSWSGLRERLPHNIQVLTMEQSMAGDTDNFLLRLEHFFEKDEHGVLSNPAVVNLQKLFAPFDVISVDEMSLGGNLKRQNVRRLKWRTSHGSITPDKIGAAETNENIDETFTITFHPMEIRTFRIYIENTPSSFFNIFT